MNSVDYKKRTISIWNEIAPRYHKRWAKNDLGPFGSSEKLIKLAGIKPGLDVLDLACGTGAVTKKISQEMGTSGSILSADISVEAIKIAKKWIPKKSNLNFIISDAENVYFNQKFDVITCQFALFFFPNAQKALRNSFRLLKKNGILAIGVHGKKIKVPFFSSILDAVTTIIPDYIPPGTPDLDRFGTKLALKNTISKAGFSKIKISEHIFSYSPGTFENYWKNYLRYLAKPLKQKIDSLSLEDKKKLKQLVLENTKAFTKNNKINFPWQVLILTAKK